MRTPPGMSAAEFAKAIAEFQKAVGPEWVFTKPEDVALYRDAYSILWDEPNERVASAAVAPANAEEVQAVVRIANAHKVPIYPISTGRNLGYGGSAPNYSGSVVLDLKRMDRILEVNEDNAYVLVEPGVSYFDLYRYFQEHNIKLVVDCPDPGWGSLVGNSLDHGGGWTMPQFRNHFDSHCGMEVVLANGEIVRTGMGALPGAKSWQEYKFGCGPWIDGIFSQSNFGVVTKMGFWAMPMPEAHFAGTAIAHRYEDLNALVRVMNYLTNVEAANGMPMLGSPAFSGVNPKVEAALEAAPDFTDPSIRKVAAENNVPFWTVTLKFYGAEKAIMANWEYAKTKFSEAIPGCTFTDGRMQKFPVGSAGLEKVDKPEFGIPSLEIFRMGTRAPGHPKPDWGHVWFSPIIPRTGDAIIESNLVFSRLAKEHNLTSFGRPLRFTMPFTFWHRSFVYIIGFEVQHDKATNRNTRETFKKLAEESARHGWGEYRTAVAFQDLVAGLYSYNDNALLHLNETLKDAIDPNGILSAGRYGIWPKHLRDKK